MRIMSKYALALLVTAACGAMKPATAQTPAPVVSNFATTATSAPETNALALPRVVPPPPAPTEIVAVSSTAPKPAVNLLTAPTIPPAWLATPAKPAVVPSGLPTQVTVKPSASSQGVAAPRVVLTPMAAAPARPALALVPVASLGRPPLQPATASAPLPRPWPPAYAVRNNAQDQGTRGVAYFEAAPKPQAPATVTAAPANPK